MDGIDPVQLWHGNIYYYHIRVLLIHQPNSFAPIPGRSHHLHVRLVPQHDTKPFTDNSMIIGHENTDVQEDLSISNVTRVPSPGLELIWTVPPDQFDAFAHDLQAPGLPFLLGCQVGFESLTVIHDLQANSAIMAF